MGLTLFGYTRTQDAVHRALLKRGSATGYAIARDTGLARANVYQALDALVVHGLAHQKRGRPAIFSALPAGDAVSLLAQRAQDDLGALGRELGVKAPPTTRIPEDSDTQRCRDALTLIEGAVKFVDSATKEVLAVFGPWAPQVADAVSHARARGISGRCLSLGTPAPEGAVIRAVPASELRGYWGGLPLALVCDRTSAVCGVLDGSTGDGFITTSRGLVPFLRHVLRRELAAAAAPTHHP